ncbi:MAG: PAC2 family protein [Actinomycetes bacterium]
MKNRDGLPFTVNGQLPELDAPTLIVMMTGWIDASGAAGAAMEHLLSATEANTLIEFDSDTFMDYRARRPVMELREGVNTRIVWNVPHIKMGVDADGTDVLFLAGPEPDSVWRHFADTVAALALQLGVEKMIGLGAYPFGAPHTRPVGLSATTPVLEIAERLSFARNTLDAPAGMSAVLEHSMTAVGIEAMTMWAQIPHYVSTMAYPAASARLVDAVSLEAGLTIDTAQLRRDAGVQRERLDQLVANNPEHMEMLGQLEKAYDQTHGGNGTTTDEPVEIPSVDELAAEVEQFLRDQQTEN